MSDNLKVSDLIAEFLKELEIEVVFGIIGSANSHIFDSINKLGYTKIVYLHHEQACVMAMGAYYRTSGKISASIITAGGGSTNAITGIASNWADSIPGIIFTGQESSFYCKGHSNLRMYGTQGLDIVQMTSKITKFGVRIEDAKLAQSILEMSYIESISGRPGPAIVDIPFDIQSNKIQIEKWNFKIKYKNKEYSYDKIISLLESSSRPLVICGNGVRLSKSNELFKSFIEKHNIPALCTWSAIDVLETDHPLNFGRFGIYGQRAANFIVQNSDLILVLGSRLALPQVGYDFSQFARDAKLILVDIDENETNKYKNRFDYIFNESCDIFLSNISNESIKTIKYNFWLDYCNNLKHKYPLVENISDSNYVNSYDFIEKISQYLAENQIIVTDMGTALLSGHQAINLKKNQIMFTSLGLGEMGYGLPGAIGAAFACPDRPVLCLNCDGGMMMNLQEAHSIIENNLNIKIIIFNNDGYLMIKHTQKMLFNGHFVGVDKNTGLGLPNYQNLMEAFGYEYYELKNINDFDDTINKFLLSKNQSVLEVFMDPLQDFIPKVKGIASKDGSIFAPPLEEMSPLLSLNTVSENMIIELSEKSKIIDRL